MELKLVGIPLTHESYLSVDWSRVALSHLLNQSEIVLGMSPDEMLKYNIYKALW